MVTESIARTTVCVCCPLSSALSLHWCFVRSLIQVNEGDKNDRIFSFFACHITSRQIADRSHLISSFLIIAMFRSISLLSILSACLFASEVFSSPVLLWSTSYVTMSLRNNDRDIFLPSLATLFKYQYRSRLSHHRISSPIRSAN